jgi:putative ABC transport system permease protein
VTFIEDAVNRIGTLPGARAAAVTNGLPLAGFGMGATFAVYGRPEPPQEQRPIGLTRSVTPGYFRVMGIPLLAGRDFTSSDTGKSPQVVVVDRTLARRYFPGETAVGKRLIVDIPERHTAEIVGVVGDVKPVRLEGDDWPTIYAPWAQAPAGIAVVVARTVGPPVSIAPAAERTIHELDREQPVADLRPMESVVDEAIAGARFNAVVLGVFAQIAFALAAVGIYGVISYDVSSRTREIGIRVALGAGRGDVLRLVLGQGARLAAYGIAVGLAAAFGLTRLMSSMLYGVKPADAWTFASMAALLGVVALAASWIPSRRAMALDPVTALRQE